jgi:hypothetical protein
MKTLLRILERAGGYRPALYLKIENPPYMALVIEATPEPGPLNLPSISVAHYREQNGDLMRDPEMCFELSKPPLCSLALSAWYLRNDYMGWAWGYFCVTAGEADEKTITEYIENQKWDDNVESFKITEPTKP